MDLRKEAQPAAELARARPVEVRAAARSGALSGTTAGAALGHAQANLVILPERVALDFLVFCQRNPKPCPVIGVARAGDPRLPMLGEDIDVRSDLPRYRVFRDGEVVEAPHNIGHLWRDDLVAVAIGCSFSFEEALITDGLRLRHVDQKRNVSMYRTTIETLPVGGFGGPLVVSMRPFTPKDAIRAIQITSRFPLSHGAPVHFGDPAAIGITDIAAPDFGDPTEFRTGEVPVFWACGVTPQVAIRNADVDLCITHMPGCMLVTDLPSTTTTLI